MASPSIPPRYPTQGPLQAGPLAPLLLPSPPSLGSPQSLLSSDAVASAALPPRSPLAVLLCPHSSSSVLVALLGSCHIGRRSFSLLWDFVFPELKSMVLSMPFDLPIKGTHCPPQSGTGDPSGVEHSSQFQESVVSLGRGVELGAPFWVGSRFYFKPSPSVPACCCIWRGCPYLAGVSPTHSPVPLESLSEGTNGRLPALLADGWGAHVASRQAGRLSGEICLEPSDMVSLTWPVTVSNSPASGTSGAQALSGMGRGGQRFDCSLGLCVHY